MKSVRLRIELLSQATFGRGDGVVGLVDQEIDHDEHGFPFLGGRTLKGLLAEEGRNLKFLLAGRVKGFEDAHEALFGEGGSGLEDQGILHFGTATLPGSVRNLVAAKPDLTRTDILEALTEVRRQTAIEVSTGAPAKGSLRAQRVLLRKLILETELRAERKLADAELVWLCACALGLRRAGTRRNRGRGRIKVTLQDEAFMKEKFKQLREVLNNAGPAAPNEIERARTVPPA